jgi:restriction system protein
MHFKAISAWTVSDVATGAAVAIFSIWLVLGVVGAVRHWARLRAEENKRRREKAISIVRETAPELAAFRKAITDLRDFVLHANAYRPKFITRFHWLMSFFPRDYAGSGDGPDPEPWDTTVGNLRVPKAHDVYSIYTECLSFKVPPPPEYPLAELPRSDIKIVADGARRRLRKLYTRELSQAEKLQQAANQLQNEFVEQKRNADEARDLIDIHIAKEKLAYDEQLAPMTSVYKGYSAHTSNGIAGHFQLALGTLALPIPSNFPWSTFYDANERLLQINQRVPFIADIVVKRADSNRPPAKKDTDNFLRRLIPAISLHIAQHAALNDLCEDVDAIAVNCWCRYFERTTGHLKNAFVSSLKVGKTDILQLNITKADALDAFRALRGAYVYSTQEIVPIEPQIRLDKKDDRFVEGKEVLEGMAQGQNLATMDWQDFEHLIRELLAKEFGSKEGSEVRITRASRDRGVDAVIFDPDPLHGGKSVVQAKRYNNLVDVSAVRDLWGTVLNEGAARGILVTTSKYGRDAYDFVSNKPLVLIDGQNLLALLAKHGFKFKIELV